MINLYKFYNKPEELILHTEYAKLIDDVVNQEFSRELKSVEHIIKRSAKYSYAYAKYVLADRFYLGENTIKQDAHYAYHYAESIINGRWKEAEGIIKQDIFTAILYTNNIMKCRWRDAEDYIKKNFKPFEIDWYFESLNEKIY